MFKGLAYMHSLGICHRDIKPQNILIDPKTHIVKICDFGSAKRLSPDEPNVSYICSRYYRAPLMRLCFLRAGRTESATLPPAWWPSF